MSEKSYRKKRDENGIAKKDLPTKHQVRKNYNSGRSAEAMAIRGYMEEQGLTILDVATAEDIEQIASNHGKPVQKLGTYANYQELKEASQENDLTATIKASMYEVMDAYLKPPVHTDEELEGRIAEYFEKCFNRGSAPVWEELCTYCGYSTEWAKHILTGENGGYSANTANILTHAKSFLHSFDSKLAQANKSNPVVYIFRAKNYYGMSDTVEYTYKAEAAPENGFNEEEIRNRYKDMGDVEEAKSNNSATSEEESGCG